MQKEKAQQTITRAYNFELRAKDDEAHGTYIEGRPIVYGSMTDLGYFNEIIEPGALTDTDLKDVRFLVNHNTDMIPLARSRRNNDNSTMQMVVDEKGMSIRVNLDVENNTDAKNLYSAVKRGDISGMSFMFSVDNEEWEDLESEHPTRYIKKIGQVLEVSAVTFPAYEATEISARAKETLDSVKSTLDSVRAQSIKNDNANDVELEKLKAHYLYNI
jgi:HK97 family phage prohead protease